MALRYSPLPVALGLASSGAAWAQQASEVTLGGVFAASPARSQRQPAYGNERNQD